MGQSRVEALGELQRRLLRHASEDRPRVDFFANVMDAVLAFCRCSSACLVVRGRAGLTCWEADANSKARVQLDERAVRAQARTRRPAASSLDDVCRRVLLDHAEGGEGIDTRGVVVLPARPLLPRGRRARTACSVVAIPLEIGGEPRMGVLGLCQSEGHAYEDDDEIRFFEAVADAVAVAISHQRVKWALRERVKELTCLHGISRIAEARDLDEATALQRIVELLPPGWQYPEITSAAIVLDGEQAAVCGNREGVSKQVEDVTVRGVRRGRLEVLYREDRPQFDEGPFLAEERNLIRAAAREVGILLERRQAEREEAERMREHLRHAAAMATLGKLAAGAAHELNEPLGAVLGFAQLAKKNPDLPRETQRDLDHIVKASLHAREIIRQVMLFARQTPPQLTKVSLHKVIRDALLLVRGRLSRRAIHVKRELAARSPRITADAAQLQQVVVNLVVNAVQAMPDGGTLTVGTASSPAGATLTVADTGTGMSQEMQSRIFMPFFTTKDVGQGTGLGLSVVHGIVSAHGGKIQVRSAPGQGTRFEVFLPARRATTRPRSKQECRNAT